MWVHNVLLASGDSGAQKPSNMGSAMWTPRFPRQKEKDKGGSWALTDSTGE